MGIEPMSEATEGCPNSLLFLVMLRSRYGIQSGDCYVQSGPRHHKINHLQTPNSQIPHLFRFFFFQTIPIHCTFWGHSDKLGD